jgi:hypothetical protein
VKRISELELKNSALEEQVRMNKVFLYMVIHDLKHPTECIVSSLKQMYSDLEKLGRDHDVQQRQH